MSDEAKFAVALGRADNMGKIGQQAEFTLQQFSELLRQVQAQPTSFSFSDYERADQEKRKELKKSGWYACGRFRDARRHADYLIASTGIVFDCDKPGLTRETLLAALDSLGCAYIAATSTSHGVDGQARYRVVLPLAEPAPPAEYRAIWAHLAAKLPGVDPGAKDPTRLNYMPRVPTGASGHEVIVRDDRPWLAAPAETAAPESAARAKLAALTSNDNLIIARTPPSTVDLLSTLADLAEHDLHGRDDWLQVGMAIHHATEGSADGLAMYQAYSRCLSNCDDGPEAGDEGCTKKWTSFGRGGHTPVTYASLLHKLKQLRDAAEKKNE